MIQDPVSVFRNFIPSTSTTSRSGIRRPRVHRRGFCGCWFRFRSRWRRFRACRRRSRPSPARGAMFTPCTPSLLKTRLGDRRHPEIAKSLGGLLSLGDPRPRMRSRPRPMACAPCRRAAFASFRPRSATTARGCSTPRSAARRTECRALEAHTDVAGELDHLPLDLGVVVAPGLLETVHVLARSVHNGHQRAPDLLGERLPELREIGVVRALCADV